MPGTRIQRGSFSNVDLELGGRTLASLMPLKTALEPHVFELFKGRLRGLYCLHYEVAALVRGVDATLTRFADLLDALPPAARRAWRAAPLRDFNIGIELAPGARSVELALDPTVLRRIMNLGGRPVVTAYRAA